LVASPPPVSGSLERGGRAARILVVDDEAEQREVLGLLLRKEGYDVETVGDGLGALRILAARLPDAILIDLQMPGIDGFELLDRVKSDPRTAALAVIVVSGTSVAHDVVRALEQGATDFVRKPYTIEILLARVRAVLRSVREREAIVRLQEELSRARKHAAIGAIAASLAHEINNPAAFVVTDLHEVKELAFDLGEAGDDERAEALMALADEALAGMHRIRDAVRDLSVFASLNVLGGERRSTPSAEPIDVAAVVRRRAERIGGEIHFTVESAGPALVAGIAGEDELDALIGLLLRQASPGKHAVSVSTEVDWVIVHVSSGPSSEEEPASDRTLAVTIARELAERFGGRLAHTAEGWSLTLPTSLRA
jgi:DNA-binding response OmpR family regulator